MREHSFAVVHLWAGLNGYDTTLKNVIRTRVPMDLRDRIAFAELDTDPEEHHGICKQLAVRNLPFLAFFRDGSLVRSHTGLLQPDTLLDLLRQILNE